MERTLLRKTKVALLSRGCSAAHPNDLSLLHCSLYVQALPVAIPLFAAEANQAADNLSAEKESQLLSDDALQYLDVAESAAISPVSALLTLL